MLRDKCAVKAARDVILKGSTPLHFAVFLRQTDCVQVLLQAGSDPSLMDEHSQTAYKLAREMKDEKIIALFQQHRLFAHRLRKQVGGVVMLRCILFFVSRKLKSKLIPSSCTFLCVCVCAPGAFAGDRVRVVAQAPRAVSARHACADDGAADADGTSRQVGSVRCCIDGLRSAHRV